MAFHSGNKEEWSSDLLRELTEVSKENIDTLADMWATMGINSDSIENRKLTIIEYIKRTYDKMVKEEKTHLEQLVKFVEDLAREKMKLHRELNRNTKPRHNSEESDGLEDIPVDITLLQTKKLLEEKVACLQQERESRMVSIRELTTGDAEASRWVGRPVLQMPADTILVPEELDQLRQHIRQMTDLRNQRIGQLGEMQAAMDDLCKTLEEEPSLEVERRVLMEDPAKVELSDENMAAAENFLERLQAKLASNQKKRNDMVEKIQSLCSRLNYDRDEIRAFLPDDELVHDRAIGLIQSKVDQLEALKRQHMTDFIAASKRELELVWKRCYYSDSQRAQFLPYHTDVVDETTLDALEIELDRLNKYHEHNKVIYDKVDEWHQTWIKQLEMEARSKDKNRLMGRGRNNLLEEEKERKAVQRRLPKVEKELMTFVEAYAEANTSEFVVMGMSVSDYICDQKAEHNFEVKEEKEIKKVIKKQQLENETRYGINAKTMTPINQTSAALMKSSRRDMTRSGAANSSVKRPLGSTNDLNSANAKRRRVNANNGADASIVSGNLPTGPASSSINSVESMALFKDKDIVSSTFYNETQTLPRARKPGYAGLNAGGAAGGTLRTPSKPMGMTSSTPSKSTTSLFKTPQSAASGSRLMRSAKGSGSTTSLSSRSNTLGSRRNKDLTKVPFKL